MATVTLSTSPTQIDAGSSYSVLVANTGSSPVELSRGGRLRPGQTQTVYPEGSALTAVSLSGAGQVTTTTVAGKPLPNPSDPSTLATDSAFTGTYATLARLADLPKPYTIAHNGTSNLLVLHTMQAYEYAFNAGLPIMDLDARLLADGTLANIHDATVDGLTSATGNVSALTAYDFKNLTADPSTWLAAGYANTTPTLISDVLARYGKDAIYIIEAKDGTASTVQKIVDLVTALGLKKNTVIQCVNLSALAPAVSAGVAANQVTNSPDTAAMLAAGVTGVTIIWTSTATIQACIAAGLTTLVYGVQRRYEHAQMAALGVHGVMSDDPLYSSGKSAAMTTDTFAQRTWAPGHIIAANSRGTLISGGKLQFSVGQNASALLGFLCPVANAAASYQIDWTWTFDAIGASASAYPFLHIGAPDDRAFPNNIGSAGYADGWRLQLQQNGTLAVYKTDRTAGTAVNPVANVGATAPTDGASVAMRVNVTPTQVILTIPAQSKTVTVTDSAFRGGYIHCGQNGLGGAMQTSLSGITVT